MAISIIGAGALAREVVAVLQANGQPIAGLIVEQGYATGRVVGLPVTDTMHLARQDGAAFIIAIGDGRVRQRLVGEYAGWEYVIATHPAAVIGPRVRIGAGTMILGPMSATTDVTIEEHVLVNPGCLIAHDCRVESFVNLSPGANLAGQVTVQEGAFIGAGAVVAPGRTIGAWAVVGAGAVVIDDVPPASTVAGVPARPIHRRASTVP